MFKPTYVYVANCLACLVVTAEEGSMDGWDNQSHTNTVQAFT